ncbi:MAG: DegT/DnrJ/EryC1/StrS aminotransferase family protein [Acidobacteriota bacterium]|nr:DegT/DnrJ/EryC1/StrS aminotransferase family protein [Acidobacteriota bacterium]
MKVPAAKIQFLPEDRQWIADRIQEVLESGQLTLGKYGKEFEQAFAKFCGVKHAIAVNSGTSSIEIILRAIAGPHGQGLAGKKVVVPANTFFATAAAVVHAGGVPVFADMDAETFALSPETVEAVLTPDVAGIVTVHIGGLVSARMPELVALAEAKGLWLVEDAAHAHGSSLGAVKAGAFGVAGSFSFYPTKVMTSGEGGMIVTNDDRIAEEALIYRDQGKKSFYENAHVRLGYNWRMSEPHAIIGLRHLARLPAMIADRQAVAAIYDEELKGFENIRPLRVPEGGVCNYYKYIAVLDGGRDRKALKGILREKYGVALSGEVYEEPLHKQPVFQQYAAGALPAAEDLCARHVCLPVFSGMTEADARLVLEALADTVG